MRTAWLMVAALALACNGGSNGGSGPCAESCAVQAKCATQRSYPTCSWSTEDECIACCEDNLDLASQTSYDCSEAWSELAMCQSALTCSRFERWEEAASPYPCAGEDQTLADACAGGVGQ